MIAIRRPLSEHSNPYPSLSFSAQTKKQFVATEIGDTSSESPSGKSQSPIAGFAAGKLHPGLVVGFALLGGIVLGTLLKRGQR